jgi:serine/threonine-protein kinase
LTAIFHPDGKTLMFSEYGSQAKTIWDLMPMPLSGGEAEGWKPGEPTPFLATPSNERYRAFSPDGRWIAYASDETGRNEVYVRAFPGPGGKWQVSTGGGNFPVWSRTKPELVFEESVGGDLEIMAATYSAQGTALVAERPRPWSPARIGPRGWSLHPDGARLAGSPPRAQEFVKQDKVVLFLNFFDESAPPHASVNREDVHGQRCRLGWLSATYEEIRAPNDGSSPRRVARARQRLRRSPRAKQPEMIVVPSE